ncbi:MAG: polysaccharide biosynthesis tyrosine autokinase [Actinomycetota bacterium]|nr:polysaccharide biosynthesis tyrosine autokinase [Actinomycetota bacterium]
MELGQYLRVLRQHWKLIWASVLLFLTLAGVACLLIPPIYSSTSKLYVSNSSAEISGTAQGGIAAQRTVVSYAELLVGSDFLGSVRDELDLSATPLELVEQIEVLANPDSVIISITVNNVSPAQAQLIANTMAVRFVDVVREVESPDPTISEDANGVVTTVIPSPPFKVTQVQQGGMASEPVAPDPYLLLPLGGLLGLLIGLALALARHFMDNTVKSTKQIEELTGAASVGGVLYDAAMADRPLASQFNAQSLTGEAYRQIRTNLQYVSVDAPPRVLVITSSVSGEGKTTTAVNLALVLAQSGLRVALIEADLRRPRVMRYLQMVGGAGLTNVLAGKAELSELLQPYGDGKLSVLAAGPHPPNPSELLGSDHMGELLTTLRKSHDYVIIDAPPLLPVTDAAVLAVLADGAVIVTRYGSTRRDQLRAAADILHGIDARVVGTVLNMVSRKGGGGGYGYGYGYGYAYEADPNPREELDFSSVKRGKPSRGQTTSERNADTSPAMPPVRPGDAQWPSPGGSGNGRAAQGSGAQVQQPPVEVAQSGVRSRRGT